ncbi:MAG: 50S ribosomal protein L4 [Candidatus Neomarinimicrobiota bacterium]|jgi:large subunit ribosomal protein L4|nr:50S ribosomal protein L4 [Candidatus Neomarinimicrobiota bacterium]MEE3139139.1 50S ribosomal protein L4 [Candidatus Neomarinimicrobiota bacterium]|tara:strand:- start:719 stop:1339 length:621 start_codon:yes stop_codon:yes gene_type:complete
MKIKSINNKKDYTVSDSVFKVPMNNQVVYQCVVAELNNARQGTSSTKNRSLVSGGGKKPFKQKGTGNARAGTIRSPLMRGGGVIFGPSPKYYFKKVNAKTKKLAFKCILSDKTKNKSLKITDSINLKTNKTKELVQFLHDNDLFNRKLTIVTSEVDNNLLLASRNVKYINVVKASSCSIVDLFDSDIVLIDSSGLEVISSRFGGDE